MKLIKKIENINDVLDFITSLDLAIKRQAYVENLDESLIPKLYVGENKAYKKNIENDKYERPILTFNLEQRGPASLSNTEFFIAPHQHGFLDKKTIEGGTNKYVQRKDNQINLTVRTKTQSEQMFLISFLERVCDLQKEVLTCQKIQHVITKIEKTIQQDFYIFNFYINIRNTIFVTERDDAIMESVVISNLSPICKFFNMTEHKCLNADSTKANEANDFKCSDKNFCEQYVPKINIKINV